MQTVAPSCYFVNVVAADFAAEIIIVSRYEIGFSEGPPFTGRQSFRKDLVTKQLSRDPRFIRQKEIREIVSFLINF